MGKPRGVRAMNQQAIEDLENSIRWREALDAVPSDFELLQRWAEREARAGRFEVACSATEFDLAVMAAGSEGGRNLVLLRFLRRGGFEMPTAYGVVTFVRKFAPHNDGTIDVEGVAVPLGEFALTCARRERNNLAQRSAW
jgi:hypothetical protein